MVLLSSLACGKCGLDVICACCLLFNMWLLNTLVEGMGFAGTACWGPELGETCCCVEAQTDKALCEIQKLQTASSCAAECVLTPDGIYLAPGI